MKTTTASSPKLPDLSELRSCLSTFEPSRDLEAARLLLVAAVGSWADRVWQSGDDVDLRAVYVLPTERYLGIGSFRDEFEVQVRCGGLVLDLVGFEVEKVARLVLKGHPQTLAWLCRDTEPVLMVRGADRLLELAVRRRVELAGRTQRPRRAARSLCQGLDEFVRRARLGDL